jgi:acetyl esterase/lipase
VAKWLTSIGLVGAILRYRLGPKYRHPAPLSDALQAVKLCRERAAEWGVEGKKIGILGFSAGGHLASSAAIHFTDSADRPDYGILIYPVITLEGPHAHGGSRTNLLGEKPDPALVKKLSNQTQVRPETPPLFLVHGTDDTVVPVENALLLASALSEKKVPFGMKIVAHGPHGFGMGNPAQPETITWPAECVAWLRAQKMG